MCSVITQFVLHYFFVFVSFTVPPLFYYGYITTINESTLASANPHRIKSNLIMTNTNIMSIHHKRSSYMRSHRSKSYTVEH